MKTFLTVIGALLAFAAVPGGALADIVVTSTGDPGDGTCAAPPGECTLREAIDRSNTPGSGKETISFAIGSGVATITPQSPLPPITDPVVIDGTTQPGFSGTPLIVLRGSSAGATAFGLDVSAGNSTVRGLVVNRFGRSAIILHGNGGNTIQGNYLGLDRTGLYDVGNEDGVVISDSPDNLVGGTIAAQRNVISGNRYGVSIGGAGATQNIVEGNYIGTDAPGTAAVGNDYDGVYVAAAGFGNLVQSNVISGNGSAGIEGYWAVAGGRGPMVSANLIGTTAGGTGPLGNGGAGVRLSGADYSSVQANVVAYNDGPAVAVAAGTSDTILGNSMYSNYDGSPYGLGIDLGVDSVTFDDALDADSGPNYLQNFPLVGSAVSDATGTTVRGTLSSAASQHFKIELLASPSCDVSGYGEGKNLLGDVDVDTDASGLATFSFHTGVSTPVGQVVTATATTWNDPFAPQGDTSEFSPCTQVATPRTTSVSVSDSGFKPAVANVLQGATLQWNFAGPNDHNVTDTNGLGLFASPGQPAGSTFGKRFTAAGSYAYESNGEPTPMTGSIRVPVNASPASGTAATTFTVTWGSPPSGFVEDVQIKRLDAASFVAWQTGQTAASAPFVADAGPGTYSFRARLRKPAASAQSGWSSAKTISVS